MKTSLKNIPFITTEQMREVDRAMIEDFHIELIQMMENAGRNLAHLAREQFLAGDPKDKRVVVLAGTGGNGGGGLVCARRLHNWGAQVSVYKTKNDNQYKGIPAHQLDVLRRMQVPVNEADMLGETIETDLIVDAVIGYSLSGDPIGPAADMINWANHTNAPILSLDAPSGIDTTTGRIHSPAIKATATMTLALPKEGLLAQGVPEFVGDLYLADISVPPALYSSPALGLEVGALFAEEDIIRIW